MFTANGCTRIESEIGLDGAGVHHRDVEAGLAPRLLIALQPRRLFGRRGDDGAAAFFEMTLDVEAPQQRDEIERRPPPHLPRIPRSAQADRFLEIGKRDTRLFGDPPGRVRRRTAADLIRFEQQHLQSCRRKRIRGRAAGQPAADDDGLGLHVAAVAGIGGNAGRWKGIEPGRTAVFRHSCFLAGPHPRSPRSRIRARSGRRRCARAYPEQNVAVGTMESRGRLSGARGEAGSAVPRRGIACGEHCTKAGQAGQAGCAGMGGGMDPADPARHFAS